MKVITIIDPKYKEWVKVLSLRYRKYMKYFYEMFPVYEIRPQLVDKLQTQAKLPQAVAEMQDDTIRPQVVDELDSEIFSIPWGHDRLLIDKFKKEPEKAKFYIHKSQRTKPLPSMPLKAPISL